MQYPMGIALGGGFGEVKGGVTAGIADRLLNMLRGYLAVVDQQGKFVHFLGGGQQVAFAPFDQQGEGVIASVQPAAGEPVL